MERAVFQCNRVSDFLFKKRENGFDYDTWCMLSSLDWVSRSGVRLEREGHLASLGHGADGERLGCFRESLADLARVRHEHPGDRAKLGYVPQVVDASASRPTFNLRAAFGPCSSWSTPSSSASRLTARSPWVLELQPSGERPERWREASRFRDNPLQPHLAGVLEHDGTLRVLQVLV
jgi:hypothetical protein